MVVKSQSMSQKRKRHLCSSPCTSYTLTTNSQSQACINSKTMVNKNKQIHTDSFWQSRNKSDKKHDLWFDPYLVLFYFIFVPSIGSDCPSQSHDAIRVAIETSSASAGRCADNVAAVCLRGCHSNAGWADSERDSTWNTSVIAGVPDSGLIECF